MARPTAPVTWFVVADGTYVGGSRTDQANPGRALPIRTYQGRIAVSAGAWTVAQTRYQPFARAAAVAAAIAGELEHLGLAPPAAINRQISRVDFLRAVPRGLDAGTLEALERTMVRGEPPGTVIAEVAGKTGRNPTSLKKRLQEQRRAILRRLDDPAVGRTRAGSG